MRPQPKRLLSDSFEPQDPFRCVLFQVPGVAERHDAAQLSFDSRGQPACRTLPTSARITHVHVHISLARTSPLCRESAAPAAPSRANPTVGGGSTQYDFSSVKGVHLQIASRHQHAKSKVHVKNTFQNNLTHGSASSASTSRNSTCTCCNESSLKTINRVLRTCNAEVVCPVRWNLVGHVFGQPKVHHHVLGLRVVELESVVRRYRDVVAEVRWYLEPHRCNVGRSVRRCVSQCCI